jgi:osmotically-inducible protein OsmY
MPVNSEQIKKDLVDSLYRDDRVDASDVGIDVTENGTVELKGTVPNYTAKSAACHNAWMTPGVSNVLDRMTVAYPSVRELPKGKELADNVLKVLTLTSSVDSTDIEVLVDGGVVTLRGSVESYWKKIRAEEFASEVLGVTDVMNELAVVPTGRFRDRDVAANLVKAYGRSLYLDPEDIHVEVKNGVVTLRGVVPNWTALRIAVDHAKYTPGVRAVLDSLRIE